jgi:hypothetical protein
MEGLQGASDLCWVESKILKLIFISSPEAYHAEFHDSTHLTLIEKKK